MKKIYFIVFVALISSAVLSCKEKTASEKFKEKMEKAGDDIKDAADDAGDATEKEAKKAKKSLKDL